MAAVGVSRARVPPLPSFPSLGCAAGAGPVPRTQAAAQGLLRGKGSSRYVTHRAGWLGMDLHTHLVLAPAVGRETFH